MEVLPKLVIPSDIRPSKTGNYQKIIYWGDIAGRTKSFIEFRSSIEQLRKKRTDFKVWVPLLKDNNQFLKICVDDLIYANNEPNWFKDPSAVYTEVCTNQALISGNAIMDDNINCIFDANEEGFENFMKSDTFNASRVSRE